MEHGRVGTGRDFEVVQAAQAKHRAVASVYSWHVLDCWNLGRSELASRCFKRSKQGREGPPSQKEAPILLTQIRDKASPAN